MTSKYTPYDVDWDDVAFCAVKALTTPKTEHKNEYADYLTQNVEQVKVEYGPDACE